MKISDISTVLKTYRRQRGLAQKQMCEKLGITRVHYSQLERGVENPSARLLLKIAEVTGNPLNTVPSHSERAAKDICTIYRSLSATDRKIVNGLIKRLSKG